MPSRVYSFASNAFVISHPSVGRYQAMGTGLGSATVTQATDRTTQQVAADGRVMTSKQAGNNGTIAVQVQQTSEFNSWLLNLWNYLLTAPDSEWNGIAVTIRSPSMGDLVNATGGAFQQRAELSYQQQGQERTWNLLFESINETNVATN